MQFLMDLEITLPPDDGSEQRKDLVRRERARATEISSAGHWRYTWIVPGRRARIVVWEVEDAKQLHELYTSQPASPWTDVLVRPLVERPTNDLITTTD